MLNNLCRWLASASGYPMALGAAVVLAQVPAEAQRGNQLSDPRYQGGGVGSAILGALICGYIASSKNRNPWGFALLGFLCCPCGIVVAVLAAPGEPKE